MVQFSRSYLSALAAAGALVALVAANGPARAEDPTTNLGPVGPREPILVTMGDQRVDRLLRAERGYLRRQRRRAGRTLRPTRLCLVRVKLSLQPGETVPVRRTADRQVDDLLCGADASTLTVRRSGELIRTGTDGSELARCHALPQRQAAQRRPPCRREGVSL